MAPESGLVGIVLLNATLHQHDDRLPSLAPLIARLISHYPSSRTSKKMGLSRCSGRILPSSKQPDPHVRPAAYDAVVFTPTGGGVFFSSTYAALLFQVPNLTTVGRSHSTIAEATLTSQPSILAALLTASLRHNLAQSVYASKGSSPTCGGKDWSQPKAMWLLHKLCMEAREYVRA